MCTTRSPAVLGLEIGLAYCHAWMYVRGAHLPGRLSVAARVKCMGGTIARGLGDAR
jgi:hypothetical protein